MDTNPYLKATPWGWPLDPLGLRYILNELYDRYNKPIMVCLLYTSNIDKSAKQEQTAKDIYGCFLIPPPNFPISLLAKQFPSLVFTKGGDGYDVYGCDADKSFGIELVLKQLNLNWEKVLCFGDAENDLTMIQKASLGVAMGNACGSLKAAADVVCGNAENDGIADFLNQSYFLR